MFIHISNIVFTVYYVIYTSKMPFESIFLSSILHSYFNMEETVLNKCIQSPDCINLLDLKKCNLLLLILKVWRNRNACSFCKVITSANDPNYRVHLFIRDFTACH